MICPRCGARNATTAAWCSQCLRPLGDDASDPGHPSSDDEPTDGRDAAPQPGTVGATDPGAGQVDRPFRTVDGEVEWRCPDCGAWNLFLVPVCARCGHRLGGGQGDHAERTRRVLWVVAAVVGVVVVVSVVLAVLALRGGPGATEAARVGGLASTATSCPPATCGDP